MARRDPGAGSVVVDDGIAKPVELATFELHALLMQRLVRWRAQRVFERFDLAHQLHRADRRARAAQ